jgi:FtsP/CotA-like multicopper oxidase with cupredoxin domain
MTNSFRPAQRTGVRAFATLSVVAIIACGPPAPPAPPGTLIAPNDNRVPAGVLKHDTLSVRLEARAGQWQPEGEKGRTLDAAAWAEEGKSMQNPGPLVRVTEGTVVHASLRNTLDKPLTVFGFGATRGVKDSVIITPGGTQDVHFKAAAAGTYYYAGKLTPAPLAGRLDQDTQLNGAIVVDPVGAPKQPTDRVFVISWYFTLDTTSMSGLGHGTMTINGLSWPHTERLDYTQGDSVRWRVVNLTGIDHPMHLHGFYFRMDAKGDGIRDTTYAPPDRRMAVTEIILPFQTMALTWSPTRPGNWIYHCHFAGHLSHLVALDTEKGLQQPDSMEGMHHPADKPHQMYGLVMGIRVAPKGPQTKPAEQERAMRLIVRSKPNVYGKHPGFAFVLGGSPEEANPDALPVPGSTLVLEKNQRVAITIVNQSRERAAIHWHGIELESFPDGVPGWSGADKDILPSIAPADSLTVHFTPPRAGTFMYHSHFNELQQITSGLYAPIVVLEPGQKFDPETDRILMFSDGGPTDNLITGPFAPALLNGKVNPALQDLRAGTTYRFRVIGIRGDLPQSLSIMNGKTPIEWRAIAKDGADLPPNQAVSRPANMMFDPGEIFDFQYTPSTSGELSVTYGPPPFLQIPGAKLVTVPLHVRAK